MSKRGLNAKANSGPAGRIEICLAEIMLDRDITLTELSADVGITMANLSNLKRGSVKAVRFSTLEAICRRLECQPSDLLKYEKP